MLFKKIDFSNVKQLYPYLYSCDYRLCDYTPAVLLLWGDFYDYRFCIDNDALFIRQTNGGKTQYFLPITDKKNLPAALNALNAHCREQKEILNVVAIPESYTDVVQNTFGATPTDMGIADADYAYDAQSLATLKGHKYNSKRNHVNRFKKDYPTAEFVRLTADDVPAIESFLDEYHKDDDSATYNYDIAAVRRLVLKMGDYAFLYGGIKIDGKIAAFSLGDRIGDTLFVHVEKALRNVSGLYETITHLFAKTFCDDARLINREEDMGDEGLRASKQSYHPVLLKKYSLKL